MNSSTRVPSAATAASNGCWFRPSWRRKTGAEKVRPPSLDGAAARPGRAIDGDDRVVRGAPAPGRHQDRTFPGRAGIRGPVHRDRAAPHQAGEKEVETLAKAHPGIDQAP